MGKFTILINNHSYELEEGSKYRIKVKDPSAIIFQGEIIENEDFEYNGKRFYSRVLLQHWGRFAPYLQ